jgi:predicted homoserine dehydrogenase-like protein
VTAPIAKGSLLTTESFAPDRTHFVYELRRMQDEQMAMERPT